jgi:hypothetical protein
MRKASSVHRQSTPLWNPQCVLIRCEASDAWPQSSGGEWGLLLRLPTDALMVRSVRSVPVHSDRDTAVRLDGAGRMRFVWLLFCCASVAVGNCPPPLSRQRHGRAPFPFAGVPAYAVPLIRTQLG